MSFIFLGDVEKEKREIGMKKIAPCFFYRCIGTSRAGKQISWI